MCVGERMGMGRGDGEGCCGRVLGVCVCVVCGVWCGMVCVGEVRSREGTAIVVSINISPGPLHRS